MRIRRNKKALALLLVALLATPAYAASTDAGVVVSVPEAWSPEGRAHHLPSVPESWSPQGRIDRPG